MKTKTYTLFWLTGEAEVIKGNSLAEAMNSAGIEKGALHALDFWAEGDQTEKYNFDKKQNDWIKKVQQKDLAKISEIANSSRS